MHNRGLNKDLFKNWVSKEKWKNGQESPSFSCPKYAFKRKTESASSIHFEEKKSFLSLPEILDEDLIKKLAKCFNERMMKDSRKIGEFKVVSETFKKGGNSEIPLPEEEDLQGFFN